MATYLTFPVSFLPRPLPPSTSPATDRASGVPISFVRPVRSWMPIYTLPTKKYACIDQYLQSCLPILSFLDGNPACAQAPLVLQATSHEPLFAVRLAWILAQKDPYSSTASFTTLPHNTELLRLEVVAAIFQTHLNSKRSAGSKPSYKQSLVFLA